MKILKIKALNINSLKGKIEIDFEDFLKDNALFAITGPTGSGKSTILDIISCALYGKTPRLKNPNDLMSRQTYESYCEVEFEIKNKIYSSSWSQKRAKKSSDGKFQSAKMDLMDLSEGKVILSGMSKVPKEIENLSGLDFERFTQSMLLAQGSFDAFLKAKESERSILLEKITGTQIYNKISKSIYEKHNILKNDLSTSSKILESIEFFSEEVLEEKEKSYKDKKDKKDILEKELKHLREEENRSINLNILEKEKIVLSLSFEKITKEKTNNKDNFSKLEKANKALNVNESYLKNLNLINNIKSTKEKTQALDIDLEDLKNKIFSNKSLLEKVNNNLKIETTIYNENTKKIKEKRLIDLKTQEIKTQSFSLNAKIKGKNSNINILENEYIILEKQYEDIKKEKNNKENYLKTNIKDESLFQNISLIESNILSFTNDSENLSKAKDKINILSNSVKALKTLYIIDMEKEKALKELYNISLEKYSLLDKKILEDNQNEDVFQNDIKNINKHLLQLKELSEIKNIIKKDELENNINEKELNILIRDNANQLSLIKEIKDSLIILNILKEKELLIQKYENDRSKLKDNEECFLCGSKEHPYLKENTKIIEDETSFKIKEKTILLDEKEEKLKISEIKTIKLEEKINASLLKENKNKKNILEEYFKNENLIISDNLENNLIEKESILINQSLEIKNRRNEKNILEKEKDKNLEFYTLIQQNNNQNKNDLEQNEIKEKHLIIEKTKTLSNLSILREKLDDFYKKYHIVFEENSYFKEYENLKEKNFLYQNNLNECKSLEKDENLAILNKTQKNTNIQALKNEIIDDTKNLNSLNDLLADLEKESKSILDIQNIDEYENKIKNDFDLLIKEQRDLSTKDNTYSTKNIEINKQKTALSLHLDEYIKEKTIIENLFLSDLQKNDFSDENEFLASILSNEIREELTIVSTSILSKYNEIKTLISLNEKNLSEIKMISSRSIEILSLEIKDKQIIMDELQVSLGSNEKELEINKTNASKFEAKIKEIKTLKESYEVWVKLNEILGSADGNKFSRFAQGITLDQLINLANRHLILLSSRYELKRSDNASLEIEIMDSYQGNVLRPVSTLSGGESFIVSLSLALGLSELASQKISIDSLFLDEGFGTLDENSLEIALNALNLLQSRGKMVGVISHVEALKERIPLQIRVLPNGDGTSYIERSI